MSKRLQVLLDESEYKQIQQIAFNRHVSVAEWVRQALREARLKEPKMEKRLKLEAVRKSIKNNFPGISLVN